jgi:hypothetical protein
MRLSPQSLSLYTGIICKTKRLLLRHERYTLWQRGSELLITDRSADKMCYLARLSPMTCSKGRGQRWLVRIKDLDNVPGLREHITPSGIFASIGPGTQTVLLSRLVCAIAEHYIRWGNEEVPWDDWIVVHHRDHDPSNDDHSNHELMKNGHHELTHHADEYDLDDAVNETSLEDNRGNVQSPTYFTTCRWVIKRRGMRVWGTELVGCMRRSLHRTNQRGPPR